jgi:hypothetical protein
MGSPTVAHGYTLTDIDRMARAACTADRSLAGDMTTRYDTAWSGIALALVEAESWPRPEALVRAGWQAIYAEVRAMQHTYGYSEHAKDFGPRAAAYWTRVPADHAEDRVIEPLAVQQIVATLTTAESRAITALAIHDDYQAAADALGVGYTTLHQAVRAARARFQRRWYAPETPPPVRGMDKRVRSRTLSAACPQGHEFTPENTWRPPGGGSRRCRTCMAAARPGARARAAEAAAA